MRPRSPDTNAAIDAEYRIAWGNPGPVPPELRGRWCAIEVSGFPVRERPFLFLEFRRADGARVGERFHLGPSNRGHRGVGFAAAEASTVRLGAGGYRGGWDGVALRVVPCGTLLAAFRLLSRNWRELPALLGNARHEGGLKHHLREQLGQFVATHNAPRMDYPQWVNLYDTWLPDDFPPARDGRPLPSLSAIVFQHDARSAAALDATLASLRGQHAKLPFRVAAGGAALGPLLAESASDYVVVLQAGEVLAKHASLLIQAELAARGLPEIAIADEDCLARDGSRCAPLFKPEPNHALMLSGTLSRGAWVVRRDLLDDARLDARLDAHLDTARLDTAWAETLRTDLWLRRYRAGSVRSVRMPFVLTHRRRDAEAAPPAALAEVTAAHLRQSGLPMEAGPGVPLRVTIKRAASPPKVTIVTPSALRAPHVLRCVTAVLETTAYAEFELVVAVSQKGPLDRAQQEVADRICRDPRARVVTMPADRFNFSTVNNYAVGFTSGEHVLLLNDDVSPTAGDWLDHMVGHLADQRVGIVGAKLLYPDDLVQHGGVLMGLAGLCEHANRFLPRAEPGYAGRAGLAQELSAVTGACLLVRRAVYAQVGGLDEAYPSAFNDVDFCLRVREAGHAVVLAPDAVLHHHELQTYGSHYGGDRAPFHEAEVSRMRDRWVGAIAADPFHNPNLALVPGREWSPAFPPRLDPVMARWGEEKSVSPPLGANLMVP